MKNISSRSWSSGCILLFGCASDCRCAAFGVIFVISSTLVEAEEARGNADPLADKFIARQLVAEGDSVKGETLLEKRARLYRFISFAGVSVEQGQSSRVVDLREFAGIDRGTRGVSHGTSIRTNWSLLSALI